MSTKRLRLAGCSLTVAVAAFLVVAMLSQRVSANRGYSSDYVYFNNAAHSVAVGEGYVDCDWSFTLFWGTQTSYYTRYDVPCGGGNGWYSCRRSADCPHDFPACINGHCS